jgi:iron complex outermembrane recepter protein
MTIPARHRILAALTATTLALAPRAASAGFDPEQLPEIIVTAEKQNRTLEETAASISALDADFIREIGARGFADLQDYTANISISLSHAAGTYAIRGFATPDTNPGFDPSVGTVVDGVYYGRAQFMAAFFHDLERFEVLRGPQGTLFGKNCTAGILNVVTRAPEQRFGTDTEILANDYGERSIKPSLSLPLGEDLAVRVSGNFTTDDDGLLYNTYLGRPEGDTHQHTMRGRPR